MTRRRYCPVCWQTLGSPTVNGFVADHFDSAGRDLCPMSGEDYDLAGHGRRSTTARDYQRTAADDAEAAMITVSTIVAAQRLAQLDGLVAA